MIQQLGYNQAGNVGALAIANSSGNFTYYPDYTTALANAKSGDTIVQFQNIVESRPVSIVLKNGVNINMNGFSYTLLANVAASLNFAAFTDNGAVTCSILNGTITFAPTAAISLGAADRKCLILNFASNITTNCIFNGQIQMSESVSATLTGGVIAGTNSGIWIGSGYLNDMVGTCLQYRPYGASIYLNNCIFITNASTANYVNGQYNVLGSINNTVFISTGGAAVKLYIGTNITFNNCFALSTAGVALSTGGGGNAQFNNCTLISTSSYVVQNVPSLIFNNCYLYSNVNNILGNTSVYSSLCKFYGCNLVTTASAVIGSNSQNNTFINSFIDCQWNNILGHAINNAQLVINNIIKVANPNAYCLNANTAWNTTYLKNTFQGATTPVSGNVIQTQTQNTDLYGNIIIG